MSQVVIVTDRGADLTPDQQREHGITVVPLIVRFGSEVILDDGTLAPDAFWQRVSAGHGVPETSQPSAGMFEEAFAPLVAAGHRVLCPLITGRLSGTCNAAHAAAQRFLGKVTVFDTESLSAGQAFQVLAAARAAKEGLSVDAIIARLEGIRARSHMMIALDTVEFLKRGGRAGKVMPILDRVVRALSIKPLLRVFGGELQVTGVARSMTKAVRKITEEFVGLAPARMLAVAHTRRPDEAAAWAEALAPQVGVALSETLVVEAGPALSAHAGPGVMAAAMVA